MVRTDFSIALSAIASERGLDIDVVLDTIKQAYVAAYKRDARERGEETEEREYEAVIDPQTGEARIYSWEEGKEEAKQDVTPPGFGRIAAQTAKQVILQKIREAEKDAVMQAYAGRVGSLVSGLVLRFDGPNVRVDIGQTEAIMPPQERIPNERLNLNQRLTFLLKEIKDSPHGKQILVSRADPEIVKKLFAREVPEISSGAVEIKAIAREPGARTKVAVYTEQTGVDPVGSCVGQKGVRVQAVINELNGEKIDVIPWTEDAETIIKAALSPAEGLSVSLNEKEKQAKVAVPEDQLSLAIGRDGQNVRLASKLTGWKIDVQGVETEGEPDGEKAEKEESKKETKAEEVVEAKEATKEASQNKKVKGQEQKESNEGETSPSDKSEDGK